MKILKLSDDVGNTLYFDQIDEEIYELIMRFLEPGDEDFIISIQPKNGHIYN